MKLPDIGIKCESANNIYRSIDALLDHSRVAMGYDQNHNIKYHGIH